MAMLLSTCALFSQEEPKVLFVDRFDNELTLQSWRSFSQKTKPNVSIRDQSLRVDRSEFGGLTALSRDFESPQTRVAVEFSLAFSKSAKRTFHIWSQEPNGVDASQINLCIQNGTLQQFDGRSRSWKTVSRNIRASKEWESPVWHRIRIVADQKLDGVSVLVSAPGNEKLTGTSTKAAAYRTNLPIQGISFVSGSRIANDAWYRIDNLVIQGGAGVQAPGAAPELPKPYKLWTGKPLSGDPGQIPWVQHVKHQTLHRPKNDQPKFLHGAAFIVFDDTMYCHWANSPTNENGPHETLRGKVSRDLGATWSELFTIAPGFSGLERHSHGVFLEHKGDLWTFCSRFGVGVKGKKFNGLKAEAFRLNIQTNNWESQGIAMTNCWPYDQPMKMPTGNYITGGQDKDGYPVVAISEGENILKWTTVPIPFPPELAPSFAETTVVTEKEDVIAIIRGGGGVAWYSRSSDGGLTWESARPTNLVMPRAKAYLGRLSTGHPYLISNIKNRDTLCVSIGEPGGTTLNRIFRIRDGKSQAPRFPGHAKSKQWSYPYAYEFDRHLYVVYSIGKEECGLSIIPISSLIK